MVFEIAAATTGAQNAAKHLISPNIHVIMVHFPLGIFTFGLFLEIFGLALWRRSSVRVAAKWMILLGALLGVPAALSGIDAYEDVKDHTTSVHKTEEGASIKVKGLSEDQWEPMQKHILWTSIGAGLAAIGVTVFLGASDRWRRMLYAPTLLALAAGAGMMSYGAHFGGEGIYLQGVAVQLKYAAATGFEWWVPARSTHVLFAGLAFATSLGALGASFRMLWTHGTRMGEAEAERELAALTAPAAVSVTVAPATTAPGFTAPTGRRVTDDMSMARSLNADAAMSAPRVPSGRFWVLASLLFLIALGLGVWYQLSVRNTSFDLTTASVTTVKNEMIRSAQETKTFSENRIGLHIGLGILLAVLPLLLAFVVRFMARARIVVLALCLLMVVLVAGEIWLGVLLSVKGATGSVFKFAQPQPTADAQA